MKLKTMIFLLIAVVLIASCTATTGNVIKSSKYDNFANCLTNSGVKMYGAYWCPHCNSQKEMFGESWQYINYIECSLPNRAGQTQVCSEAGVEAYPTWEFTGQRMEGELTLEKLSQLSGCPLE